MKKVSFLSTKRDIPTTIIAVVCLLLVGLGVITTFLYTSNQNNIEKRDTQNVTNRLSDQLTQSLDTRTLRYKQILLGFAAAYEARGSATTQADWKKIYDSLRVSSTTPELLGVGFAQVFPKAYIDTFTDTVRRDGAQDFIVTPGGDRDIYTAIRFIEPFNAVNQKAFGFDMFTEPHRRAAMEYARDNATFGATDGVVLKQDEGQPTPSKSILIYYPLYLGTPATQSERARDIIGYTYLAVRVADIMKPYDETFDDQHIAYHIKDGKDILRTFSTPQTISKTSTATIAGRPWTIELDTSRVKPTSSNSLAPFISGVIMSAAIGYISYTLLTRRIITLREQQHKAVQEARDDLLALASHQLRTPATGVKQYLAMLEGGFFGKLSPEQGSLARKAYLANERQLETIDQMLYVAKADAGQLNLDPRPTDILQLTEDIVAGYDSALKAKCIAASVTGEEVEIAIDSRLVRMIIENLISNAIKYSEENTTITISVKQVNATVHISVTDQGVGISEADVQKLFYKFSRIQNKFSHSEGGSGLGLFLARKLARAHEGDITVSSKCDEGSTFTLILPMQISEQNVVQLTE